MRDRQHQIDPDESNAYGPCPTLVLSEGQNSVAGLLGCRHRRAGGKHERQNTDLYHSWSHIALLTQSVRRRRASAVVRWLQPATRAGLVVPIDVAKTAFQVRLLARYDAVKDSDCQRQRDQQDPRALRGHADAALEEKHAEIDGIAGPAVNACRYQHARGLDRLYRCPCLREVANARACKRQTDKNQRATDDPMSHVG